MCCCRRTAPDKRVTEFPLLRCPKIQFNIGPFRLRESRRVIEDRFCHDDRFGVRARMARGGSRAHPFLRANQSRDKGTRGIFWQVISWRRGSGASARKKSAADSAREWVNRIVEVPQSRKVIAGALLARLEGDAFGRSATSRIDPKLPVMTNRFRAMQRRNVANLLVYPVARKAVLWKHPKSRTAEDSGRRSARRDLAGREHRGHG